MALEVVVVDVGGSNVKFYTPDGEKTKVPSGPDMTPDEFREKVSAFLDGLDYEAVSIGFPSVIRDGKIVVEPANLGEGWIGCDFGGISDRPVKVLNDAAMQAYGGYRGGRMLFLGFGTGLGSAMVNDGTIIPLELCDLRYSKKHTLEDAVGKPAFKSQGRSKWNHRVHKVIGMLQKTFLPDEILIGGGNAKHIEDLPDGVRLGGNRDALAGGRKLWEGEHEMKHEGVIQV